MFCLSHVFRGTLSILFATLIAALPRAQAQDAATSDSDGQKASQALFQKASNAGWSEVFSDPCTEDWKRHWTLDGLKAALTNDEEGMAFLAGPNRGEDTSHAVLWTKASYTGDFRLDYEYTNLNDVVEAVTILYLQATGSGAPGYGKDISTWRDKREVAAMRTYYNHMNLLHISYAAFNIGNTDPREDYIRARRYLPERDEGLADTGLKPDYARTGLFKKGVPHKITVIKKGGDLFMHIRNRETDRLCHWKTDSAPAIREGRIGLRHMWTRGARYRDFRISQLSKK